MLRFSGPIWCDSFLGSTRVEDLADPFQDGVSRFIAMLRTAGANVSIGATWRPEARAYLMHWCWQIASGVVMPREVPAMEGVDIDWQHAGDYTGARLAAQQMKDKFKLRFLPSLTSRHTQRRAIDMTISWDGVRTFVDAAGAPHPVDSASPAGLWPIGASFGVIKLQTDPPHWSDDGH